MLRLCCGPSMVLAALMLCEVVATTVDYKGRPADDFYNYSSPAGWAADPANPDPNQNAPPLHTGRSVSAVPSAFVPRCRW